VVRREIFRLVARLKEVGATSIMTTERVEEYGPVARFGVEEFVSDNVAIVRNVLEGGTTATDDRNPQAAWARPT
jgi:circadian clock protein KaiC